MPRLCAKPCFCTDLGLSYTKIRMTAKVIDIGCRTLYHRISSVQEHHLMKSNGKSQLFFLVFTATNALPYTHNKKANSYQFHYQLRRQT